MCEWKQMVLQMSPWLTTHRHMLDIVIMMIMMMMWEGWMGTSAARVQRGGGGVGG